MRSAFTIVARVNRSVHPRLRYYLIPYPIITSSLCNGWLVGSESRQKGGSRRQKSALWPRAVKFNIFVLCRHQPVSDYYPFIAIYFQLCMAIYTVTQRYFLLPWEILHNYIYCG